jgi:hypothetical protein
MICFASTYYQKTRDQKRQTHVTPLYFDAIYSQKQKGNLESFLSLFPPCKKQEVVVEERDRVDGIWAFDHITKPQSLSIKKS